ncbi:hypothetical protein LINPERPRIM_LOCUS29016 [Linum perenne]
MLRCDTEERSVVFASLISGSNTRRRKRPITLQPPIKSIDRSWKYSLIKAYTPVYLCVLQMFLKYKKRDNISKSGCREDI